MFTTQFYHKNRAESPAFAAVSALFFFRLFCDSPSDSGKFREKSNIPLHSERLQQGADSSSFAARAEKEQTKRVERSAYRAERTGAKLEKATKKRNQKKPPKNPGVIKSAGRAVGFEVWRYTHGKINQVERENVGTEASHKTELAGETAVRGGSRFVKHRIRTRPARQVRKWEKRDIKAKADYTYKKLALENPALTKNALSQIVQKQRIKRKFQKQARAAAKKGAKAAKKTAVTTEKITSSAVRFVVRDPKVLLIIGIALLLFFIVQSCMGMVATVGSGIAGAGGAAESAETIYTRLETELQQSIDNMETTHPGYDEYRRITGPIGHNPAEIMGFLLVRDSFAESEMENVLKGVFDEQYTLTTREITETSSEAETSSGTSTSSTSESETEKRILEIALTVKPFAEAIAPHLTAEQLERFNQYDYTQ